MKQKNANLLSFLSFAVSMNFINLNILGLVVRFLGIYFYLGVENRGQSIMIWYSSSTVPQVRQTLLRNGVFLGLVHLPRSTIRLCDPNLILDNATRKKRSLMSNK